MAQTPGAPHRQELPASHQGKDPVTLKVAILYVPTLQLDPANPIEWLHRCENTVSDGL